MLLVQASYPKWGLCLTGGLPLAAVLIAGCAGVGSTGCAPMLQAQLFFGRDIAGRAMVSEVEWRRFLDEEVSPRFPDGLSVGDLSGQYRNTRGMIVHEQSKTVLVLTRGGSDAETKLNAIRDAYKRRFSQESVLLVETPVCAQF